MVWDDVRTAIGQLRRRWFESLIVVVMVTGGAALAVSIVELGLRFGSETERDLRRPEHRRLFVLPAMNRHSSGGAVTRLANAAVGEVEFSRDLIAEAAESVPQVHDP